MNENEVKSILLRYRPGTAGAEDPQVAEALARAEKDPALAGWLKAQQAQQEALRAKFKQIVPPAGLKEQIVSEYAASRRRTAFSRLLLVTVTVTVMVVLLEALTIFRHPRPVPGNALAVYESQMVRAALSGYAMDLLTNNPAPVRAYLAAQHAPADLALPASLQQAALTGCAVQHWRGAPVSLICFRTGRPLPPGMEADLWLFVVDKTAITNAPSSAAPQIAKVNRLMTAAWSEGGRFYFLGVAGQEADIRKYL